MSDTVGRKKKRPTKTKAENWKVAQSAQIHDHSLTYKWVRFVGEDRISRHRCATAGVKEAEKTQRGN
jgi:hypothetical protein